ncbi:aspartate-semialdehyde dehydrogenase [candidate division KSB1 bacterium]|nr:aspartate-semialdehyde dehydrogenase [candidate division KSB1 bacterium]
MEQLERKLKVGILGATGAVGQKFVQLLENHPWFEVTALAASARSSGRKYAEIVQWTASTPLPDAIGNLTVQPAMPSLDCDFVFSGLDAAVAGEIETAFANAGYPVLTNSRNHRFDADVPLLIPEINPQHLPAIEQQASFPGYIVTNPNCAAIGLAMALKPLYDNWGIRHVHVVTLQAISGAGYPGVASLDIFDNVIPFIAGEEEKIETETQKILGDWTGSGFQMVEIQVSAQCNRVPVLDGHLECVSVKLLNAPPSLEAIIDGWQHWNPAPQQLQLPSAPQPPLYYFRNDRFPQPRLHRGLGQGMAVSIGRLKKCPVLDVRFVVLSHNTIRGAAGGAILNAEYLVAQGYLTPKKIH